ncbi:MAG TPA: hypothetical protein VEJ88_01605 [Dissulfurispiraceae bacterium]|nr:hypothetical protein [Dissulfurispiraceae bacterium]
MRVGEMVSRGGKADAGKLNAGKLSVDGFQYSGYDLAKNREV